MFRTTVEHALATESQGEARRDAPPPPPAAAAAVLALQRQVGNRATAALLSRQPKAPYVEEFVFGDDIALPLARRAQELAAKGIGDAQLRELRDLALKGDESVNDTERLFLTGLLEPGNAERLAAARVRAGEKISLPLALDKSTRANLRKVADIGRPDIDPDVTAALDEAADAIGDKERIEKATKRADQLAAKQLLALAGGDKRRRGRALAITAYATEHGVPLPDVLAAAINTASDSTEGDLVSAATAYAVAAAAGHRAAPLLRAGAIKIDERPIKDATAYYNPTVEEDGEKADTVSVPGTLDVTNLYDRGTIIHELQHALQDASVTSGPPKLADRAELEVEAYTTEADYALRQIVGMAPGAARRSAASQVAAKWGLSGMTAAILAAQADASGGLADVLKEVNALRPAAERLEAEALGTLLGAPAPTLRNLIKTAEGKKGRKNPRLSGLRGESAISGLLPRKRIQDAGTDAVRFTIGVELTPDLAKRAWELTQAGVLDDKGLAQLRAVALSHSETIDDNERMFMAGLLHLANKIKLHGMHPGSFEADGLAVDFESQHITTANRNRVKDFGRNERPAVGPVGAEQEQRERGTDAAIDREMLAMAGPYRYTVMQALALADDAKILHVTVYFAMLAAASDSTPADRALSAAAYVIARREGMPEAQDLVAGRIKVDAVPAGYIRGDWEAMYATEAGTTKGDTLYLQLGLDPSTLLGQGTVVHELTHAAGDKASRPGTHVPKGASELEAYRREARFYLESIDKLTDPDRTKQIETVGEHLKDYLVRCLIIEANARTELVEANRFADIVRELNAVSFPLGVAEVERGLNQYSRDQNEKAAIRAIMKAYKFDPGATTLRGGLRGESELDA